MTHVSANIANSVFDRVRFQQFVTLTVDHLTLIIGHIIEFQQLLTDIEVAPFHLALSLFNGVGHHAVLNRLALLHPQGLHKVAHPVGGENTHQVVFQ